MSINRLVITFTLPFFLTACSEFYSSQPPAPIYGDQTKNKNQATNSQKKSKSRGTSINKEPVKTQALKDFSEIKAEPLISPALQPIEQATLVIPESLLPKPSIKPEPTLDPVLSSPKQELSFPVPTSPDLTVFKPMETTTGLSPAIGALVSVANQNTKSGDLELAAASIERAIRIEPRNATLFYKLAVLRLKQAKPGLAEDLAKKSALLAATDDTLKKHCWLLIAHAREVQQDVSGAKEAQSKADSF